MFHPVGSQPPSVYWRRRLVFIGAVVLVVVLLALTISTLRGGDGGTPTGSGATSSPPRSTARSTPTARPTSRSPQPTSGSATPTGRTSGSASGSTAAMPTTCALSELQLTAVVGKSDYTVGDSPLLQLQVTNTGSTPCTRDLADKQIELRVYNGTSRVWGSHDCATKAGTDVRTLAVGQPYRFGILWGGLSSTPACNQATRQRVGAGSYTLYASLAGKSAAAAQFQIG